MDQKSNLFSRFIENKVAVICSIIIIVFSLFAFVGPFFLAFKPSDIDYYNAFIAPFQSWQHPFGTDDLGRDILARMAYGGRISLGLGLSVAIGGSLIGMVMGAVAGYYGGFADKVISWVIDILLSIPTLALLMVISGIFTVEAIHLGIVMAFLGWMGVARLVRGEVLSLRNSEFIQAARTIGVPSWRIVARHIIPNVMAPVTVAATLAVAYTILTESALSYLGFGVQPPTATWGNMLQGAQRYMRTAPWLAISPGLLIAITVTCFNFIGDALREAVDPRLKGRT